MYRDLSVISDTQLYYSGHDICVRAHIDMRVLLEMSVDGRVVCVLHSTRFMRAGRTMNAAYELAKVDLELSSRARPVEVHTYSHWQTREPRGTHTHTNNQELSLLGLLAGGGCPYELHR